MDADRFPEMPLDWTWHRDFFGDHGRRLRLLWDRVGQTGSQHLTPHDG